MEGNCDNKGRKYFPVVLAIILTAFLLRTFLMSRYFDDWDGLQFALGMHEFNIAAHQPHPPGYPAYVFLASLFDVFIQNDLLTLSLMSALAGSLSVVFVYLLGKELFSEKTGMIAAAIIAFTPAHLIFSIVAMSDIVFLLLLTISAYFLYRGLTAEKYFFIGSFITGYALGIRPQNIILIGVLFPIFLYWKKGSASRAISVILAGIGAILWFAPAALLSGGVENYIRLIRSQIGYVDRFVYTTEKIQAFVTIMTEGWSVALFVLLTIALVAFITVVYKKSIAINRMNGKPMTVLLIWTSMALFASISLYQLYTTRYILPLFVPMSIIFGVSIEYLAESIKQRTPRNVFYVIITLVILVMAFESVPHAYLLHNTAPAPVQAADYIAGHFSPEETLLVAGESYRHFQYYLPNYESRTSLPTYENISNKNVTRVVSDIPLTIEEPEISEKFYRSYEIYPRHDNVTLYNAELYYSLFPRSGIYPREYYENDSYRWMTNNSSISIFSKCVTNGTLNLEIVSPDTPRNLSIEVNNKTVKEVVIGQDYCYLSVSVDLNPGDNTIRLYSEDSCKWAGENATAAGLDNRYLAFLLRNASYSSFSEKTLIDIGSSSDRHFVSDGFSANEKWFDSFDFSWSDGNKSDVIMYSGQSLNNTGDSRSLRFRCMPFIYQGDNRTVDVYVNGILINSTRLTEGWGEYSIEFPAHNWKNDSYNTITMKYYNVKSPEELGLGSDPRHLSVAFDWIEIL